MGNTKRRNQTVSKKQRSEADIVSNKVISAFIIALAGTFGMMFLRNRVAMQGPTTMVCLKILAAIGAVVFIAGIFLHARAKKAGNAGAYWYVFLAIAGLAALVCAELLLLVGHNICAFLAVLLPLIAIFYFLHTVFNNEYFISLCIGAVGSILFWYTYRHMEIHSTVQYVLYAIAVVLMIGIFVKALSEKSGKCKKCFVTQKGCDHIWLFLSMALVLVGLVLSLVIGAVAAYVMMFVSIAYLLVSIIVMTVKLG